jgi:hypothetical protein
MTTDPQERFERIYHQLEFLTVSAQSHDSQLAETARLLAESARLNAETSRQTTKNSKLIEEHHRLIEEHYRLIAEKLKELADFILRFGRIAQAQDRRMDKAFARIAEAQARTDERLSALINAVERHISNSRN